MKNPLFDSPDLMATARLLLWACGACDPRARKYTVCFKQIRPGVTKLLTVLWKYIPGATIREEMVKGTYTVTRP